MSLLYPGNFIMNIHTSLDILLIKFFIMKLLFCGFFVIYLNSAWTILSIAVSLSHMSQTTNASSVLIYYLFKLCMLCPSCLFIPYFTRFTSCELELTLKNRIKFITVKNVWKMNNVTCWINKLFIFQQNTFKHIHMYVYKFVGEVFSI